MSRALITESYLTGIANAIRAKLGVQDTYTPPQMAAAIESIPTGGITPTGTVNISQNGTHDVTEYASANVNVQPNLQSKTATQNGTVVPDQGYDGLSSVVVNVSGGGVTPESVLSGTMTQNENGINFSERSVNNNRGTIKGVEYSAGFEGFNVQFTGLTSGKNYVCVFSWETKSGAYFQGEWMYGFKISDSQVSSYDVRYGVSGWQAMTRDLNKHSYAISFIPTGTSAYLVFALPGYSDGVQNTFELTGLMVLDPAKLE